MTYRRFEKARFEKARFEKARFEKARFEKARFEKAFEDGLMTFEMKSRYLECIV